MLVAFILGCVTASTLDSSGAHVGALSFAAVFSSLVLTFYSCFFKFTTENNESVGVGILPPCRTSGGREWWLGLLILRHFFHFELSDHLIIALSSATFLLRRRLRRDFSFFW